MLFTLRNDYHHTLCTLRAKFSYMEVPGKPGLRYGAILTKSQVAKCRRKLCPRHPWDDEDKCDGHDCDHGGFLSESGPQVVEVYGDLENGYSRGGETTYNTYVFWKVER